MLVQDCRLSLALVFAQLDDMNSSSKAETLLNEIIMSYNSIYEGNLSERMLKAKDELVKFYLKQDKYDVRLIKCTNIKIFNSKLHQIFYFRTPAPF